jgi:hypothetical protein
MSGPYAPSVPASVQPRATPIATTAKGIPGTAASDNTVAAHWDELVLENQLAKSRSPYVGECAVVRWRME